MPEGEKTYLVSDRTHPILLDADVYKRQVREKLRQAEEAALLDSSYSVNVEALRSAQPKDLDASEIEVRLGATWIDKGYVRQFMLELLDPPFYLRRKIGLRCV